LDIVGAKGVNENYRSSFLLQRAKVKMALGQDPQTTSPKAAGTRPTPAFSTSSLDSDPLPS